MARKNTEELMNLQDAITQIKQLKEQMSGKNLRINEALSHAEKYLFNKLYDEISASMGKAKS